jgi:pimeloyl-ACP methyl ester carboxylesterase
VEARYTKSGDVNIAYGVAGDGDPDVVFIPGFVSHVEMAWTEPPFGPICRRLSSIGRLVHFDKRGTGMSDRTGIATLEERMDDVRAVMDAAGVERAALVGISEGGPMSLLFAATYPERVSSLVLWASSACLRPAADDYPVRLSARFAERFPRWVEDQWGSGDVMTAIVRHHPGGEERLRARAARFERYFATPGAARTLFEMNFQIDVRHVLPAVTAPTLVVHRTDDPLIAVAHGRYLAEHLSNVTFAELPGDYHIGSEEGDDEDVLDEIERFLTGEVRAGDDDIDRVLKTVLFTDIVDSTRRAVELGDRRWRAMLDEHDAATAEEVRRFRGEVVKTTGDGVLAVFDGPARAIRAAIAVRDRTRRLGVTIRAGLHCGECEVRGDDIGGIAVHTGSRIASLAGAGEIVVSSTVRDLVAGSGLRFADRGRHELKGIPGSWELLTVVS